MKKRTTQDINNKRAKIKNIMPIGYDITKEAKADEYYHLPWAARDNMSKEDIIKATKTLPRSQISPGQMLYFLYDNPKYADSLEYYDRTPVVIILDKFINKEGEERFRGFNIHFLPRAIRIKVCAAIIQAYNIYYKTNFSLPSHKPIWNFTYHTIKSLVLKAHLEFCVRAYIPSEMASIRFIPPELWSIAVQTEGQFNGQTRNNILRRWKQMPTILKPRGDESKTQKVSYVGPSIPDIDNNDIKID